MKTILPHLRFKPFVKRYTKTDWSVKYSNYS